MAIPFRSWSPTKSEADLLVDMLTARLAPAKIAILAIGQGGSITIVSNWPEGMDGFGGASFGAFSASFGAAKSRRSSVQVN
jgi:hypothetical protein